jgi:hypothetical protein
MNFSFQTVVLLVVVTLLHLATIASIFPLEKSAIGFLARVDLEELMESFLTDQGEAVPRHDVTQSPAAPTKHMPVESIPGFPGQEMDTIRARSAAIPSVDSSTTEILSVADENVLILEMLSQSQVYSGRSKIPTDEGVAGPDSGKSQEPTKPSVQVKTAADRHGIRMIRPLNRS